MLYQILFRGSVTNLLRLVLLREYNLCEAYIRLFLPKQKKEKVQSVQGEEYEKGEKQKEGGGNLKNCLPRSQYYPLASFFDPNKSSNSEFQSSGRTPGSFTFSTGILVIVVAAAALTLFVRSYGSSSMA